MTIKSRSRPDVRLVLFDVRVQEIDYNICEKNNWFNVQ